MNKITGAYDLTDITEKQLDTVLDTLSEFSVNSYDMESSMLESFNFFGENIVNLAISIGDKLDELSMNSYALGTSILDSYITGNESLMNLINSDFGFLFSILQDTSQEEKLLASVNQINESIGVSQKLAEALGIKMDNLDLSMNFSAMTIEALMVAFNPIEKLGIIISELSNGFENINGNLQMLVVLNTLAEKLLENISSQVTIQATLSGTANEDSGVPDSALGVANDIGTGLLVAGVGGAVTPAGVPLMALGGVILGVSAIAGFIDGKIEESNQEAAYEKAKESSNILSDQTSNNKSQYLNPYLTDPAEKNKLYNDILSDLSGAALFTNGTSSDKINWPVDETTTDKYDQNVAGFNKESLSNAVPYPSSQNEVQIDSDNLKHLSNPCSENIKVINNSLTPTININLEIQEVFDKDKLIQEINNALIEEIKFAPEGEYEG